MTAQAEGMPFQHSKAFRHRRFWNWFPLGLTYAMLYMGRYNLTVAANSIVEVNKEDFGLIFFVGTMVYGCSFLLNGPLTDKVGGKRAILAAALGSATMNLLMGLLVRHMRFAQGDTMFQLVPSMTVLYAVNMYFQSFGAVAIVKINSHWFHVRERGGFSGIFGSMIASGIFFAFTVNGWLLSWTKSWGDDGAPMPWWVFFLPSIILYIMFAVELFLLKDRPGLAKFEDFDTGDASSGEGEESIPVGKLFKRLLTNPIIVTVALVEFCTGVLRNGVMHWFVFYTKEVWVLPPDHFLRDGSWAAWYIIVGMFAAAAVLFVGAAFARGRRRVWLIISGALVALMPFVQAGWGGLLMVAGIIGGNVAGWVSDLFFQSRRAPTAAGLYLLLVVCVVVMIFSLGGTTREVGWTSEEFESPLQEGDEITEVEGQSDFETWPDVARAVACVPSRCQGKGIEWDADRCMCSADPRRTDESLAPSDGIIDITVMRNGSRIHLEWDDPKVTARAGEKRVLPAGPVLTLTPYLLGVLVFLISLCVIGTHGLLSGTATMDFGGRKAAATAVGMIDGLVYLGTGLQSVTLGFLTTRNWMFWPVFLLPFSLIGFFLLTRIWNAKPKGSGGH